MEEEHEEAAEPVYRPPPTPPPWSRHFSSHPARVLCIVHIVLLETEKPVPEIIDLVFEKTSPKRSFSMTENERFGLVFANTGSINSGTGIVDALIVSELREKLRRNSVLQCHGRSPP